MFRSLKVQRGAFLVLAGVVPAIFAGCGSRSAPQVPGSLPTVNGTNDIAIVNGTEIPLADFYTDLQAFVPSQAESGFTVGQAVLNRLMRNVLIEQLAHNFDVYPTDAEVADELQGIQLEQEIGSVEPYDKQLADSGVNEDYVRDWDVLPRLCQMNIMAKNMAISDDQVNAFYEQNKVSQFTQPDRAHIKRIVLATKADADATYQQLKTATFDTVYGMRSVDRTLPGGDVPEWVSVDNDSIAAYKPLVDLIRQTDAGKIAEPIKFQGQWWVVQVVEKRPKETWTLDQVRQLIHDALITQQLRADPSPVNQLQKDLRNKMMFAQIQINAPQYKQLAWQIQNPSVIIPQFQPPAPSGKSAAAVPPKKS